MVAKLTLTFSLDLSSDFNPTSSLVHHTIQFQHLETSTMNNPKALTKDWVKEGPLPIPERAMINCYLL